MLSLRILRKSLFAQTITMNNNTVKDNKQIDITDQNWLMYKHIQSGKSVKESYHLAGYKGKNAQAPYQLYHKLKKRLELIWDADNADSLRLKMEAKKIMDMPVKEKEIKAEVKLKAIETLYKLQDKERKDAKTISPFIVFKTSSDEIQASNTKVIQAQVIEPIDVEVEE